MCVPSFRIYCLRELGSEAEENDSLKKAVAAFWWFKIGVLVAQRAVLGSEVYVVHRL